MALVFGLVLLVEHCYELVAALFVVTRLLAKVTWLGWRLGQGIFWAAPLPAVVRLVALGTVVAILGFFGHDSRLLLLLLLTL